MTRALENGLRAGVVALGLELSQIQHVRLLDYLDLIQKWTKVYNLTSVRNPEEMLTHHVFDSLSVLTPLRRQLAQMQGRPGSIAEQAAVLDVGSGAGLPGVVIAICCPELLVHCVDTVAKKAAFIKQVAVSLGLPNLQGIHARVESLIRPYDIVCSRAFASLPDFVSWSDSALADDGVWLGMKGRVPEQEIAALPVAVQAFHVEQLLVPGLDAQRCIVWMRKSVPPVP